LFERPCGRRDASILGLGERDLGPDGEPLEHVYAARGPGPNVRGGGVSFGPSERVDDTGAGASEQTRPRLAWASGACYAVWEDDRNGTPDIYLGRRSCRAQ
jgi:hypothetical protein